MQNRCTVVAYIIKQAAFLCKAPPVIKCHKNPAFNQLVVCHPAQTSRNNRLPKGQKNQPGNSRADQLF